MNDLSIKIATNSDFTSIKEIAYLSWKIAYSHILSKDQMVYMLNRFYEPSGLQQNLDANHLFFLIQENNSNLGFVSIEYNYQNKPVTRLHKLYLHPSAHGKGIGKFAIDFITKKASENNNFVISLNVNKYNNALHFYKKIGFKIVDEEILQIGEGYVMDDYKMELNLITNCRVSQRY